METEPGWHGGAPQLSFTTARSGLPSLLKSATTMPKGSTPTAFVVGVLNVPSPSPSNTETVLSKSLVTARSSLPSRLKSPVAINAGSLPTVVSVRFIVTLVSDAVMSKKHTFDVPPPGAGFTTVTDAVPIAAMSEARMLAVILSELSNVVVRAEPFQLTTDPATKPAPFTVSVNPAPPGAAALGESGWLTSGTGLLLEFLP